MMRSKYWIVALLGIMAWTPATAQPYSTIAAWSEDLPGAVDLAILDQVGGSTDWAAIREAMSVRGVSFACRIYFGETGDAESCLSHGAVALVVPADRLKDVAAPDSVYVIAVPAVSSVEVDTLVSRGADAVWLSESTPDDLEGWYQSRAPSSANPSGSARLIEVAGAPDIAWILAPGSIALPDHVAMGDLEKAALEFRGANPSIATGIHEMLSDSPYAFYRGVKVDRDHLEEAIVVFGAEGRTSIKVSRVLPDNSILRDRMTGAIGMVSFGEVSFEPHASGLMLLEVVQ